MRALLASMPLVPALLLGRRNDVLAWNRLGHALMAAHLAFADPGDPATRPDQMRLQYLGRQTRELHRDGADKAALAVASLLLTHTAAVGSAAADALALLG